MKSDQLFMVFDVESVGLHGEGFAVGMVVMDRSGNVQLAGHLACPPDAAAGSDEGRAWIAENCPPIYAALETPQQVRESFWGIWQDFKALGAILVADCAWPVEARFLIACVDDAPHERQWQGPYPLVSVDTYLMAAGMDPLMEFPRLPDEQPHHPLGDAKQSARLLVQALSVLATTTLATTTTEQAPDAPSTGE